MSKDLQNLEDKIKKMRESENLEQKEITADYKKSQTNKGVHAGISFIVNIMVGFALGYHLDKWLGTSPWLFLTFFFGGVLSGFLSVFKISKEIDEGIGFSALHKEEKDAKKAPKNVNDAS